MCAEMTAPDTGLAADDLLAQAQAAADANRLDEAQDLLFKLIHAHPESERAWLLLADIVPDVEKTIECLQRVLAINPDNARARQSLALAEETEREVVVHTQSQPAHSQHSGESAVRPIGQYLLEDKALTVQQLEAGLAAQAELARAGKKKEIGAILIERGVITEQQLRSALNDQEKDFFSLFWD